MHVDAPPLALGRAEGSTWQHFAGYVAAFVSVRIRVHGMGVPTTVGVGVHGVVNVLHHRTWSQRGHMAALGSNGGEDLVAPGR